MTDAVIEKIEKVISSVLKKSVDTSSQKFLSPVKNILDPNIQEPIENKIKNHLFSAEIVSDFYSYLHEGICANPSKKEVDVPHEK